MNYNTEGVIRPTLPGGALSPEDRGTLEAAGFQIREDPAGGLDLLFEEAIDPDCNEAVIEILSRAAGSLPAGEQVLELEASYTTSRPCADGTGGFATLITPTETLTRDTRQLIADFRDAKALRQAFALVLELAEGNVIEAEDNDPLADESERQKAAIDRARGWLENFFGHLDP